MNGVTTMRIARQAGGIAAAVLALAAAAGAQQNLVPHIGYVYPAGGQRGSTVEVTVGGQYLTGVSNAYAGAGVKIEVTRHLTTLTPQQLNGIKNNFERLDALVEAGKTNAVKRKEADAMRERLMETLAGAGITNMNRQALLAYSRKNKDPKKQLNPAISETVTLAVTIAADAEPGDRDLRLEVPNGLSNPMIFRVGDLPEYVEREPVGLTTEKGTNIVLPAVVNGQIMPGDIDRVRFQAVKGQKLVIQASARELIPYLADAVPGWFQATLSLTDAGGREVAYDDDFRFHPDPVLYYQIPADGEYTLAIKDSIFRGREDFVYRIAIGELPFITGIYPLGGRTGEKKTVELKGWNLPASCMSIGQDYTEPGIRQLTVRKDGRLSNPVSYAVDRLPECIEQEPNSQQRTAQAVTAPVIVNGRIEKPSDRDVFSFKGKAGQEIIAEVYARRLDSPLDGVLKLTDADDKVIASNDDREDKGAGLTTHHADPYIRVTLPADGTYYLAVSDTQHGGGPDFGYRLRVAPPQPDFELRAVPASINVRPGGTTTFTVFAMRKDGMTNAISLALTNAPAGFSMSGGRIGPTQDQVRVTLTAPAASPGHPLPLHLVGRAAMDGFELTREAVAAEDMMQAFAYRHLVPAQELLVDVKARFSQKNSIRIVSDMPLRIPSGGKASIVINAPYSLLKEKVRLELNDPPEGLAIDKLGPSGYNTEIVLKCDAAKIKPGLQGNLIVNTFAARNPSKEKTKVDVTKFPFGTLPAIPFEIVSAPSRPKP